MVWIARWAVFDLHLNGSDQWHTAISRKVVGKNVQTTIPKGDVGYDQYHVPDTVAVEPRAIIEPIMALVSNLLLLLAVSTCKHKSMASRAILANFFEEQ